MNTKTLLVGLAVLALAGCEEEKKPTAPAASVDAARPPPPPASASAVPAPSATAAVKHDCPKNSAGDGTFSKPCEAKGGKERAMEVVWTGKTDDKGPHFRVTNKTANVITYGKMAIYFYDKAGKQLEVKDPNATPPKTTPFHTCSGNMFGGVMKAGEKAVLTFSCASQKIVPEGTKQIEAEMSMVGFADATEKKIDFYWQNKDLVADARPKGGLK